MNEMIKRLLQTDDDYLIGISNKGIVKRAYKDLENASLQLEEDDEGLTVRADDFSCRLAIPVNNSSCSCPSRSICKHVVMSVIFAKNQYSKEDCSKGESEEKANRFEELNKITLSDIKKWLGLSSFRKLLCQILTDEEPEIIVSSIVTVRFSDSEIIVKLLVPIEDSTCTCHKREICIHKARAILWYQLKQGYIDRKQIEEALEKEEEDSFSLQAIKVLADTMEALLREVLFTGLARISPETGYSCERLAVMSHNEKLPEYEKLFRSLAENFQRFFNRHASVSSEKLMLSVALAYDKANRLETVTSEAEVRKLAGKMKSEYYMTSPLLLMGMGQRSFHSQTGYEGETVYFLEEETGEFYTYTRVRPVFYEQVNRRSPSGEYEAAPWHLNCRFDELSMVRLKLVHGKVNDENRLSSSAESEAELTGKRDMSLKAVRQNSYDDFSILFEKIFGDSWHDGLSVSETHKLAIIRPKAVMKAEFDSVAQIFFMQLSDKNGGIVNVRIHYRREERTVIRHLERLYRRIEEGRRELPDFFGIFYLENGQLCMYPIEYYDKISGDFDTGDEIEAVNLEQGNVWQRIRLFIDDCLAGTAQIFQSGLFAADNQSLQGLLSFADLAKQYGFLYLAEKMELLCEHAGRLKHQIIITEEDKKMIAGLFCEINRYIQLGRIKTGYDEARARLIAGKE